MRQQLLIALLGIGVLAAAACTGSDSSSTRPTGTPEEATNAPAQVPSTATTAPQPSPTPGSDSPAAQEIDLRVSVFDDTVTRPLISGLGTSANSGSRVEVWVRGYGSWFPDLEFGGDVNTLGTFPVGEENEFFIYPDGREGHEIRVPFQMTSEMISGSARDTIQVGISDTTVNVFGTAIADLEQDFER